MRLETVELDLAPLVAAFGRRLHAAGVPVTAERSARLASALTLTRPVSRTRLYWTARAVHGLATRRRSTAFDRVFFAVFGSRVDAPDERRETARGEAAGEDTRASTPGDVPGQGSAGDEPRPGDGSSGAPGTGAAHGHAGSPGTGGADGSGPRGGQRRGAAGREALRRARAGRAGADLHADDPDPARDAAAAHAARRAPPPRRAHRPAAHAARLAAHRRRPDLARPPAPPRRAAAARPAV